jgi:hypothetical protein
MLMRHSWLAVLLLCTAALLHAQSIPDFTPPTPLFRSILAGDAAGAKRLIATGTDPNEGRFLGSSPLLIAIGWGHNDIARALIEAGADINVTDPGGGTALMWAAYNDAGDADVVDLLLAKGADVNARNKMGETALMWAMRRGYTPVVRSLRAHGASERPMIADSLQRAVAVMQKSGPEFLKVSGCVSCHNQSLPQMTYAIARNRGIAVDRTVTDKQAKAVLAMYKPFREQMMQGKENIPDPAISVSYALLGLAAEAWPADETTAAMAHLVSTQQNPDGSFRCIPARPPMESSSLTATALSIRALQSYGSSVDGLIAKGREWLRTARARTTEERAMRLLGLAWSKADAADLRDAAKALLEDQRVDGGWGQLAAVESDAYATGQALYALTTAGQIVPADEVWVKGAGFLLRTQRPDGSWLVRTRSNPFQPLKESGFPHGRDQWISAAGTSWAAMALGAALPQAEAQMSQAF